MARINKEKLNELLKAIPDISPEERQYLMKEFEKPLVDGLSEYKFEEKARQLLNNRKDIIDDFELRKVKEKISEEFKKDKK